MGVVNTHYNIQVMYNFINQYHSNKFNFFLKKRNLLEDKSCNPGLQGLTSIALILVKEGGRLGPEASLT